MPRRIAVIETWVGPELIGIGECRTCGWRDAGTWQVGLVRIGPGEWSFDEPRDLVCPRCGLSEVDLDLNADLKNPGRRPDGSKQP